MLNDDARGATVEAVISRMKTVQSTMTRNRTSGNKDSLERASMRLIAISATIPNVEDVSRNTKTYMHLQTRSLSPSILLKTISLVGEQCEELLRERIESFFTCHSCTALQLTKRRPEQAIIALNLE